MGINTDKNNLDSNNKDGYVNTDGSINELDSLFDIDSKTSDDVSLNDIFDVKNNSKSGLNGTKTNIESINAFDIDKDDDIGVDQSQNNNSNVKKKSKIGGLFGLGKRVKQDESEEDKLKAVLHTYKNRGISIVVTGTSNSGKSTLAYNLANIVANLGYSVLIVDMDTVGRSQAFISKQSYNAVHSLNPENASLKQALNAVNTGVSRYVNIIRPGFHLLTMGLGGDIVEGEKLAPKTKLARFATSVRRNYHCIIYDMPFNVATEYAEDITITSDNIVLSCEASTHGLMNMLLLMCNINSGDVEETMFTRSQICFTKYKGFKSVLGVNVRNELEVLNRLDSEVQGLLGIDPEYYFSNLSICGLMGYDERYDASWFSERAYTDLVDGREEYIKLLSTILLKR